MQIYMYACVNVENLHCNAECNKSCDFFFVVYHHKSVSEWHIYVLVCE